MSKQQDMTPTEQLAQQFRKALGKYDDPEEPLPWLISDLVARLDALEQQPRAVPDGYRLVPTPAKLKELLVVGTQIRLGETYCAENPGHTAGTVITLVEGTFDHDNGLYSESQFSPSVWDAEHGEFDSIYHLFDNDLSGFMDCEIVMPAAPPPPAQAEQQYFYRVNECTAIDSKSDLCICWHDQGTGPFPDAKPDDETPSNWRAKPVAVSDAPCDKCGYNGPGYYQPDTHPCVAQAAGGVGLDDVRKYGEQAARLLTDAEFCAEPEFSDIGWRLLKALGLYAGEIEEGQQKPEVAK